MKWCKVDRMEIRNYLESVGDIDQVLVRAVRLVPEREFYQPEIQESYYQALREEIRFVIQKANSTAYRAEKALRNRFKRLVKAYQNELSVMVAQKKNDLISYLLYFDRTYKELYLETLIRQHRLLPYLRGEENDKHM